MMWATQTEFIVEGPERHQDSLIGDDLALTFARDQLRVNNDGTMLFHDHTIQRYGWAKDPLEWGYEDGRYRVCGILGFIPNDSGMSITPDYSLDASEVYINFAHQHILHEGLTIVGLCFLHGIMQGELFSRDPFEEEFIEIV